MIPKTLYIAWHKSAVFWQILQWCKAVRSLAACPVETVVTHCMSLKESGL